MLDCVASLFVDFVRVSRLAGAGSERGFGYFCGVSIVESNYITISLYHYILISLYIYITIYLYIYIYPRYKNAKIIIPLVQSPSVMTTQTQIIIHRLLSQLDSRTYTIH